MEWIPTSAFEQQKWDYCIRFNFRGVRPLWFQQISNHLLKFHPVKTYTRLQLSCPGLCNHESTNVKNANLNSLTLQKLSIYSILKEWKVMTNQLTLAVSLQLVRHSRLSSSLFSSPGNVCKQSGEVGLRERTHSTSGVPDRDITVGEADRYIWEWFGSVRHDTCLHLPFFRIITYRAKLFRNIALV